MQELLNENYLICIDIQYFKLLQTLKICIYVIHIKISNETKFGIYEFIFVDI